MRNLYIYDRKLDMDKNEELLRLAARAVGYSFIGYVKVRQDPAFKLSSTLAGDYAEVGKPPGINSARRWNPLICNSEAFSILLDLGLSLEINEHSIVVTFPQNDIGNTPSPIYEYPESTIDNDGEIEYGPSAHKKAARLAIVRAAAEIGKRALNA